MQIVEIGQRNGSLLSVLLENNLMTRDRNSSVQQQPDDSVPSNANLMLTYQVKLKNKSPRWLASTIAGNHREQIRLRSELESLKGAPVPLLMKQRNGGTWSAEERQQLRNVLRSASNVSPYLLIWVIPGSLVLLPLLAWYLDARRKQRK